MNRRNFLQASLSFALAPCSLAMANTPVQEKTLILIELNGGNDGLNTVIPYSDPVYYQKRPTLAISRDKVIQLNEQLGLHPSMKSLLPLWQKEQLAVISGLGYASPNRSHFRSIDIWETASDSHEYLEYGWYARSIKNRKDQDKWLADGIILRRGEGPLRGNWMKNISIRDPRQLPKRNHNNHYQNQRTIKNPALAHILETRKTVDVFSRAIKDQLKSLPTPSSNFPKTNIGQQLQVAANIIRSEIPVRVIKISHGSFDTHANQKSKHARLLLQFSEAISHFSHVMNTTGYWDKIVMMTYSEFGRRVAENGSKGTDHGTAAPHFVMGGNVRGGLYGQQPSLKHLDNGDLIYTTDYRQMYHSILKDGLGLLQIPFSQKQYPAIPDLFRQV